jgi:HK97 gp10 family phage protein
MAGDDLEQYLNDLPERITKELSDVLRVQAFRLSDAQRRALQALEQEPAETGHLEASCTVVTGDSPLEYFVEAGGDVTTGEVREGSGVPYDYAEGFEFGNSHQPARPFFYPTYRAMRDDIQNEIEKAIEEVLQND